MSLHRRNVAICAYVLGCVLLLGSLVYAGWRSPYTGRNLRRDIDDLRERVERLERAR